MTLPAADTPPIPFWNTHRVATFAGQFDTHIETGEDYGTATLAEIFAAEPTRTEKGKSWGFVPSCYCGHDAREHARQREVGSFVALCGDVDSGDHPMERIASAVRKIAGDAAWLIYSSAHARDGDMRWRIILPLDTPLAFDDWHDAQVSFFTIMESAGIQMDHALARAAQPVYLPNVPAVHAKSGTALRGRDGEPLYYRTASTGTNAPGLRIDTGAIAGGIAAIRRKRADDDRERERIKQEAALRRAQKPQGDGSNIIADFNAANSVATMLELCGYEQSPRHAEDWRSPNQTGDTYATRIMDDSWVSLSATDTACGIGQKCKSGCFGDAYDLYVHYKHRGDHKAAYRQLGQERRDSQPNVIYGAFAAEPPPPDPSDPGWQEPPGQTAWTPPPRNSDFGADAEMIAEAAAEACAPFEIADLNLWAQTKPTPKAFVMAPFIPRDDVIVLTGDGGTNKTTLVLQLLASAAANVQMLGMDVTPGSALFITAEDDNRENHWRLVKIAAAIGTTLHQLAGRLHIVCLRGRLNNELATFDSEGKLRTAPTYAKLRATIEKTGAKLVALDNVAHLYAGNENDRGQVTAFINLLYQICGDLGVTIILIAHRNKSGDSYSGSTAWLNAVRSQILLERSDEADPDLRRMTLGKANYARPGEGVTFRWHDFALVRDEDMPATAGNDLAATVLANADNARFLTCLAERNKQHRQVSEKPTAANYAPKQFEGMPQAKGMNRKRLEAAMDRLFRIGAIERGFLYRDTGEGKDIFGLREASGKPETSPETSRKVQPESSGDPQETTGNTPPYINISGAASEAAAPVQDIPIPGWDDGE